MTWASFSRLTMEAFLMVSEASFSFGITSRTSSRVRMNVYVNPISSTTPVVPSTSTWSPIRSGCVKAIISPAMKFPSVF